MPPNDFKSFLKIGIRPINMKNSVVRTFVGRLPAPSVCESIFRSRQCAATARQDWLSVHNALLGRLHMLIVGAPALIGGHNAPCLPG